MKTHFQKVKLNGKRLLCVFAAIIISAALITSPLLKNNNKVYAESLISYSKTMYVFGTSADLVLYGDFSTEESKTAATTFGSQVNDYLYSLESRISTSYTTSYVYAFNSAQAGTTVEIDEDTYNLLSLALKIYQETGGYYNAGVYYSVNLFGFGEDGGSISELPEQEYIQAYASLAQCFSKIALTAQDGKYYATKPEDTVTAGGSEYNLSIDLGGIAKGYATDAVQVMMDAAGYEYGYFSFGTSSMYIAKSYTSEDGLWTLTIRNPRSLSGDYFTTTRTANSSVSTSGDYENYYEADGVRFCHIINPVTGMPVNVEYSNGSYSQTAGIISATLVGGSAAENDARTTAIIAMGIEKAVDYCSTLTDMQFILVLNKADITDSDNQALKESSLYLHDNGGTYAVLTNIENLEVDKDFLSEGTSNYTALYIVIAVVAVVVVVVAVVIIYKKVKSKKQAEEK